MTLTTTTIHCKRVMTDSSARDDAGFGGFPYKKLYRKLANLPLFQAALLLKPHEALLLVTTLKNPKRYIKMNL